MVRGYPPPLFRGYPPQALLGHVARDLGLGDRFFARSGLGSGFRVRLTGLGFGQLTLILCPCP